MAVIVDQSEIVFPGTKFYMLIGDYGAPNTGLPAPSVDYQGTWPAGLGTLGYTKGGVAVQINKTVQDEYFDQDIDPVEQLVTQRDIRMRSVLGQVTPEKVAIAMGFGEVDEVESTDTVRGTTTLVVSGIMPPIEDKVVAMEAAMKNGLPIRLAFHRAQAVANITLSFMKNTTVNIPFEARAMNDTTVDDGQVMTLQKVLPLNPDYVAP